MSQDGDFLEEEIIEPDATQYRERFKGRCAPRLGQVFDLETGVERVQPLNPSDEGAVRRFKTEEFMVPLPASMGPGALSGMGSGGSARPDTTRIGRSLGPRSTGPGSDHSSERRDGDSARPFAYASSWVAALAQEDHVGNYHQANQRPRYSRRQRSPSPVESTSYRSAAGSQRPSRAGSHRRSASPADDRGYPVRQKTPPRYIPPDHPVNRVRATLSRRAKYLEATREWAQQVTDTRVLWQIPPEYGWSMEFLKQGILVISEASEVRLRLLGLMTPGVQFARHVLALGIEHGIRFHIGVKNSSYTQFAPLAPQHHRAITKAQIESTDHRLEPVSDAATTHSRYLRLLGEIALLPNARGIIGHGGGASWILRAHGYVGLVNDFMSGPSSHITVYHGGVNDAADDNCAGIRWDDVSANDYQCIHGFVPGATRDHDSWMYPTDELLEDISKHYFREWNAVIDDHFKRIKAEWEDHPCRGHIRTRREWVAHFHTSNHGRFAPAIEVNMAWMEEGKARLAHAFVEESWNKKEVWALAVPEVFKQQF
ncbi:hypothetical protein C8R46DRAFT_1238668 [Mycena filopes]|nr:hypothetical protein C8R46DRAFT_1238668 [Mycena filopes]